MDKVELDLSERHNSNFAVVVHWLLGRTRRTLISIMSIPLCFYTLLVVMIFTVISMAAIQANFPFHEMQQCVSFHLYPHPECTQAPKSNSLELSCSTICNLLMMISIVSLSQLKYISWYGLILLQLRKIFCICTGYDINFESGVPRSVYALWLGNVFACQLYKIWTYRSLCNISLRLCVPCLAGMNDLVAKTLWQWISFSLCLVLGSFHADIVSAWINVLM